MNQIKKPLRYNQFSFTSMKDLGFKVNRFNKTSTSNGPTFLNNITFEALIFIITYSFIFLTGIFTNLRVILLYTLNKNLKKCKNYYFVNLSVSSLIILLQCVPISITDLLTNGEWMFGVVYCNSFINFY